jgi:hypothetical protein
MRAGTRALGATVLIAVSLLMTACGSNGPASTESGALQNLKSVLTAYNAATPTDVASTGLACGKALTALQRSSLLAAKPVGGKDLVVREDLRTAYLEARKGFSDCATGARTMEYVSMAHADAELASANESLQKARSARG